MAIDKSKLPSRYVSIGPESVADGEVATWHKQEGDTVSRDELIVEIVV